MAGSAAGSGYSGVSCRHLHCRHLLPAVAALRILHAGRRQACGMIYTLMELDSIVQLLFNSKCIKLPPGIFIEGHACVVLNCWKEDKGKLVIPEADVATARAY